MFSRRPFPRFSCGRLLLKLETAYNWWKPAYNWWVDEIFIGRICTATLRLKLLYSKSPTTFQIKIKFRLAYCVLKILCVLLQQNILSRLPSLVHSIWLEILPKFRIFPKENFVRHNNMSNERPVKLKLYYLISEIT